MQIFRILALRVIRWHETSGDVGEKGPGKEEAKGGGYPERGCRVHGQRKGGVKAWVRQPVPCRAEGAEVPYCHRSREVGNIPVVLSGKRLFRLGSVICQSISRFRLAVLFRASRRSQ